jgi:hypothetical protein
VIPASERILGALDEAVARGNAWITGRQGRSD